MGFGRYRFVRSLFRLQMKNYVNAIGLLMVAAAVSWWIESELETRRYSMVFLAAVLVSAVLWGRNVGLFSATVAFLTYNFLLVEPKFTFTFAPADDLVTIGVFYAVAILTGGLAGRVRDQRQAADWRARTMTMLFETSREASQSSDRDELAGLLASRANALCAGPAFVFLADAEGQLQLVRSSGDVGNNARKAAAVAEKVWHGHPPVLWDDPKKRRALAWVNLSSTHGRIGLLVYQIMRRSEAENGADTQAMAALAEVGSIALDRAQLIDEVTRSRVEAETGRLRGAILSSISHDFRTPLSAILASSSGLLRHEAKLDEVTSRGMLTNIKEQAERLNRYVRNMLDIIKIESGGISGNLEVMDVIEVINAAVAVVRDRLGQRSVKRAFSEHAIFVEADPILLEQVLLNLLENAIKFSEDGSLITVSVTTVSGVVEIIVADQGSGIPKDQIERVFEKFHVVKFPGRREGGTGLGLSIARGFVEAMNGDIWAESPRPDGPGTRIHIVFPKVDSESIE